MHLWSERHVLEEHEQKAAEEGKICKQRIQQMKDKLQKVKASHKDQFAVNRGQACDNWLLPAILEELFPEKQPPPWDKKNNTGKTTEETISTTNGYGANYKQTLSSTPSLERLCKSWRWCCEPMLGEEEHCTPYWGTCEISPFPWPRMEENREWIICSGVVLHLILGTGWMSENTAPSNLRHWATFR